MKVYISARETVRYSVTVDITDEDYKILSECPSDNIDGLIDPLPYEVLMKYLPLEICSSDGYESVEILKVEENGKR